MRREGGDDYQEGYGFEVNVVESESPEKRMENVKSSELFSPMRPSRLSVTHNEMQLSKEQKESYKNFATPSRGGTRYSTFRENQRLGRKVTSNERVRKS